MREVAGLFVPTRRLALACLVALGGCSRSIELELDAGPSDAGTADAGSGSTDAGGRPDAPLPACGPDERTTRLVYYGTEMPTVIPLSAGQVLAVVDFGGCSGAFVSDEWVLTAEHCGIEVGRRLCVGMNPLEADVCFTADRVEVNPSADMALVHVDAPASARIPALEPIPIVTETLDATWIGRTVEAAGYGTQEDGAIGEREFTAEPIVDLDGNLVVIDGMGTRGVCFGDSGGPLMALASDSTVRVIGTLSFGDPSCVGQDSFTRTDLQLGWIEAIMGPVVVDGAPCGRITQEGDCLGARTAAWCDTETGTLTSEVCATGLACGWDLEGSAYRCVAEDPCGGVSAAGRCDGGTAEWCDQGVVRTRGCAACGELCRYVSDVGGFYCRPDPCIGIDPMGECDGEFLTFCDPDDGAELTNCAELGRVCGFSERRGRNSCIRG